MRTQTIGRLLNDNNGFGLGFGVVRLLLAFGIMAWHIIVISSHDRSIFDLRGIWFSNYCLVPMFFGLSGFLIAGSANRLLISTFFGNRAARILPALFVEVVLSAIVLGFLLTELDIESYFSDPLFAKYFRNLVGLPQFVLPGVKFLPPYPYTVNGALWTIPGEITCYLIMGSLLVLKIQDRPVITISLAIIYILVAEWNFESATRNSEFLGYFVSYRATALIPCFLLGISAYNLRNKIPYDFRILLLAVALIVGISFLCDVSSLINFVVLFPLCLSWTYIVVFVGVTDLTFVKLSGDYSYGIYLYHFPIAQSVTALISDSLATVFLMTTLSTVVFSAISWHLVEKPILKLRKSFSVLSG